MASPAVGPTSRIPWFRNIMAHLSPRSSASLRCFKVDRDALVVVIGQTVPELDGVLTTDGQQQPIALRRHRDARLRML